MAVSACAPRYQGHQPCDECKLVTRLRIFKRKPMHLLPENAGFEAHSAAKIWSAEVQAFSRDEGISAECLQELPWQEFFSDPAEWWDTRWSKKNLPDPEFRQKKSTQALWFVNCYMPAWLVSQLAMWDGGTRTRPGSVSTSVEGSTLRLFEEKCRKLCQDGRVGEAVDALNLLVQQGCHISNNLFYRVLHRCTAHKDLVLGRRIHALTVQSGYEGNSFLATHLIGLYASHGMLEEAMRVFSKVRQPSAHNWASIISAYGRHGDPAQAIALYRQMRESTVKPDNHTFAAVLKACANAGDLAVGKDIHADIHSSAVKPDMFVQTCLVDMYANCGSLEDAQSVFDNLCHKNVVTWTAMIAGYAQQGLGKEALCLYSNMQQEGITPPNSITFVCLLQACAGVGVGALQQGKKLHAQIEERKLQGDVVLSNSLVNMYAKCGSLKDARRVFDRLPHKNVVTWNAIIAGYAQEGMGHEALNLYRNMQQEDSTSPNFVTFVCLLQACAGLGAAALHQGKQLHAEFEQLGVQMDVVGGSSLVNMYAKCGSLEDAQRVFDTLLRKDVVTWTAMIAGYAQQGMGLEALSLYSRMQEESITPPDSVTFVCLLQACAIVGGAALPQGKELHVQIEERGLHADVVVGNSLVNMYAKCGRLEDAHKVFDRLLHRDVVTWNAMIIGYSQKEMGEAALNLYSSMQQEGITPPDSVTFVGLLQACASVAALPLGKQLHAQIKERGLQSAELVGPSLINMYAKCGSLEDAQQVFDSLPNRDIVAWGALISGYAHQGDSEAVFHLIDRMRQDGAHPNGSTFLSVLTVCSHVGLVEKGRKYFEALDKVYGITPTIEHYRCMMDLLGRAGHLDEALKMVDTMPFQPDRAVWLTLLGASQKWNDVQIGQQAFESAVTLDRKDGAAYILMSNIYMGAQMWEEAEAMQARRVKSGASKQPGKSWWIDMDGVVHSFMVGDRTPLHGLQITSSREMAGEA